MRDQYSRFLRRYRSKFAVERLSYVMFMACWALLGIGAFRWLVDVLLGMEISWAMSISVFTLLEVIGRSFDATSIGSHERH